VFRVRHGAPSSAYAEILRVKSASTRSEPTHPPVSQTGHFGPLLASAISDSPTFATFVRDWRENDQRDRRATPRFADIDTLAEMRELYARMKSQPFAQWGHRTERRETGREASSPQPGKALEDHARAPVTWGRRFGLDADELFACLRGSATELSLSGPTASMTGAPSTAFAYVLDDDRWPADTRRRAYVRQLKRAEPDGTVYSFKIDARLLSGIAGR
jgi:hypothetical protein